jgi:hypothetical protein
MARHMLTKLKAAERQIRTACDLYFLHGDLVSVMTLAGAAEEICGNLLRREGKTNILGIMHEESKRQGLNLSEEAVYSRASKLRNALKHAKSPAEDRFTFDDEAAVLMLVRAVINLQLCGRSLPPEAEKFISWVRQHGLLSFYEA